MTNIETFLQQFENWVLKDIRIIMKLENGNGDRLEPDRTAFNERRPLVAAVILMCCAIDCLARFRYGRLDEKVGDTFKDFVQHYFTKGVAHTHKAYDKIRIYKGLRNALLHGYSLGKDLGLVHQSDNDHLRDVGKRTIVDVFSLYFDLESVYIKYKDELLSGQHINEFEKRWQKYPLLEYIEKENVKGSR